MPIPTIPLIPADRGTCFISVLSAKASFAPLALTARADRGATAPIPPPNPPSAMATHISALPPGFSWLRATCRPSFEEVAAYAQFIAAAEGHPDLAGDSGLQHEAELQLWIWRTESRLRSPQTKRRRAEVQLAGAR